MKPIYLNMQAFGSYQQARIDFTQVQNGLFLITGDTGAGKTTIFDAITFALFDETSGGKRSGEMMRSQYARQDLITEVEFQFLYYDQIYTVIRRPKQEKYKAKTDADGNTVYEKNKTPLGPDVELILPDGTSYPGKKTETDKKIREIIGLDASQFTQIAMLAQGDFMKLLQATSKERMEIFAKIFDTRVYRYMEQELQERAKESNIALKRNEEAIQMELQRLRLMENSAYAEQFETQNCFRASAKADEVTAYISQLIAEAEENRQALSRQETIDQKACDQLQKALNDAETFNAIWEKYQSFLRTKQNLDDQRIEMEALQKKAALGKKADLVKQKELVYLERKQETEACQTELRAMQIAIDNLEKARNAQEPVAADKKSQYEQKQPDFNSRIARIEAMYPQYQVYETAVIQQGQTQNLCDTMQKTWYDGETLLAEKLQQKQTAVQRKEELEQKQEHVEVLDGELKRCNELLSELEGLIADMKQLEAARISGQKLRILANEAENMKQRQEEAYNQLYQQFLDSQAAILAQSLEEGQPCPVCGSRHHEPVSNTANTLVESSTLKAAQNKLEQAREEAQKAKSDLQQAISDYKAQEKEVLKNGQKYYDVSFSLPVVSIQDVEAKKAAAAEEKKQLQVSRTAAEKTQQALKNLTEMLTALEQEIGQKTIEQQALYQKLQDEKVKLAGYTTTVDTLKGQLQYSTETDARSAADKLKQQLQHLKTGWETEETKLQNIVHQLQEKRGAQQMQQNTLTSLTEKQNAAYQLFVQTMQAQGFVTEGAYRDSRMPLAELEAAEAMLEQYQNQIRENQAQIRTVEDEVKGKEKQDTQGYQAKLQELQVQMKQNRETATLLFSQIENNQDVHDKVQNLYRSREIMLRENSILRNLDATANGKLSGKHLKFQTYIQRRYFQQIVDNANKRLYVMSGGQFILQCRDTEDLASQGFVGLDLDVYSIVNDQSRDVKTLSGGESFMAALSLALGMADMIQNTASSVHIDTMFIDEGFGSLSEETRNQAIAILNELSGGKRLVGIISHVTELKHQIDRKLVVTKTEKGSKAAWEIL